MFKSKLLLLFFIILIGLLAPEIFILASTTDGTIDSTYRYAWGENIGWIDFGTGNGNVRVADSGLSGYALSENVGWIYLDDVDNDGAGNLSGYAWSENTGWINFAPTYGGVIINSSGEFTGSALSENVGWIIFGGDYKVKTDWRPRSARPQCNNATDDDSDGQTDYPNDSGCSSLTDDNETNPTGGGAPPEAYNPPASPAPSSASPSGGFKVLINNNEEYAKKREVVLEFIVGKDTEKMAISSSSDFSGPGTGQIAYQSSYSWDICQGQQECSEGVYAVYVQFYTQYGVSSGIVSDFIVFRKEKSIIEKIKEIPGKIIDKIKEIIIPKPTEEIKPSEVPIEELVPEEAPSAFQGKWKLLPSKPINQFVLAPLPKNIRDLAEKFPELEKTFEEIGITKITDLEKLKDIKLSLPTIAFLKGIPIAKLSAEVKQQLPAEMIFAKTGGGLIDFNIGLAITEKGESQQKITTISGKPLQLAIKPDYPVKKIRGYLVFNSRKVAGNYEKPLSKLTASLIFAGSNFAQTKENVIQAEEKLILQQFEYTDFDEDGIYTAEIQAPLIEGEYEIITIMDYENLELGQKEIRLITVVDPEGYIYEKIGDKEARVPGAIVSLYWLNPETKQYELWPAKNYQQENPQVTNNTGKYSFLVPEGSYYLTVEAPSYLIYEGKPFQVKEGSGVHLNIELKTKNWWLKYFDWKTGLLILVIILLLYNFYRDKIREKLTKKS